MKDIENLCLQHYAEFLPISALYELIVWGALYLTAGLLQPPGIPGVLKIFENYSQTCLQQSNKITGENRPLEAGVC